MSREENQELTSTEPTVLDWIKSILRLQPIPIPEQVELQDLVDDIELKLEPHIDHDEPQQISTPIVIPEEIVTKSEQPSQPVRLRISAKHLRLPAAVFLALFAQLGLESRPENVILSVLVYLLAGFFAGWGVWAGDFRLILPESVPNEEDPGQVKLSFLAGGSVLMVLTFFISRLNEFTPLLLFLWIGSLTCLLIAFWEGESPLHGFWNWLKSLWHDRELNIRIRPWHMLVSASIGLIIFFRFTQLESVPFEMWSDHAEKLWDVIDVLEGRFSIFFPRNTGREALQFYMAAATAKYLGTGISFNTLKIGTILAGLFTLPYLYLFAKEYGGRYVGLAAVLFAGIAYWPNIISRIGLRFPLYPLFVAPAMYYLLRGLRLQRRNDFLLCGFAVGLGLHGYSPARVIPVAVILGVLLYIARNKSKTSRIKMLSWLILAGVIALAIYTPLLGAVTDMMDVYLGRMMTRFTEMEQPLPGSPLQILLSNIWNGLRMFAWDDGEIWVISVPHRPALDWVTGAFFHLGVVIVFMRFLRERRWQDLFLLLLIPTLMIPSILALTFPGENPAINRASGAIIPVFTIMATSWVIFVEWLLRRAKNWAPRFIVIGMMLFLFLIAARSNYRLVFRDYALPHRQNTWNVSEIGAVIRGFANTIGSYDTAHVIPFAHWVDTRLVGINAGDPKKDYGVWPQDLDKLPSAFDRPQLFIFKPEDEVALARLKELHPNGVLKVGVSEVPGRDFMLYYVFPDESIEIDSVLPAP